MLGGIGKLAENLVQGLTGSEALGDIAGIAASYFTGDVFGVAKGGLDLFDNVAKGATKFAEGVWGAAKDAVKEFSNPGAVKRPNRKKAKLKGYAKLKAENKKLKEANAKLRKENAALKKGAGGISGPGQIPGGGSSPISGPGQVPTQFQPSFIDDPAKAHSTDSADAANLNAILNDPSLSLEAKIMMLLMALQSEERKNLKKEMTKMTDAYAQKAKLAGGEGNDEAKALNEKAMYESQAKLQDAQNKISELSNLLTNMQKTWHDTKMATIGNIR